VSEQGVRDFPGEWTILRGSWFSQNFSEGFLLDQVVAGEVALPAGDNVDLREPFVDVDDIADVAVAALTEDGHAGKTYELTGPRLLTFGEAVAEIAQATGRPVRYVSITAEQFAVAEQLPADWVKPMTELLTDILDGRNAQLTDGIQRVLGRKPRDFSDHVRESAAAGVWARR
jgi:uncharacterized protein YbjT (DUF2867 family)